MVDTSFEVRNIAGKRFFMIDRTPSAELSVMGDVDELGNKTQIYVDDINKNVGILAKEGLLLQAASDPSNTHYTYLKTDNIIDTFDGNEAVIQMPAVYEKTLAVSVDGIFTTPNGNIELNSKPVWDDFQSNLSVTSISQYTPSNLGIFKRFRISPYLKINSVTGGSIQLQLDYLDENGDTPVNFLNSTTGTTTFGTIGVIHFPTFDIYATCNGIDGIVINSIISGTINYNFGFTIHKIN